MTETYQIITYVGNSASGSGTLTLTIDGTTASGTITLDGLISDAQLEGSNQDVGAEGDVGFANFVNVNYSGQSEAIQVLGLLRKAVLGPFGSGVDTVGGVLYYFAVGGAVPVYLSFTGATEKS